MSAGLIELPDAFLMIPVMRGIIGYRELLDGTLDLADLDRINLAIAIQDENTRRYQRAVRETAENG